MLAKNYRNQYRVIRLVLLLAVTVSVVIVSSYFTIASPSDETFLYLPTALLLPCGFVDEVESNNTFAAANGPLLRMVVYRGCYLDESDIDDVYFFELLIPSTIEVTLQNIAPGHDYDLVLYDANRKQVALSNNPGNQDEHILLNQKMAKQRYYIQVNNYSRTASTQAYHLLVKYDLPLECNLPAITEDVFPQLQNEPAQFPFYAMNPSFQCHAVDDIVHTGLLAIRMDYVASPIEDGYWGIATPEGFDASQFEEICFWAYVEAPFQAFRIHLKDTNGVEKPSFSATSVNVAGVWQQYCIPLSQYAAQGVELERLENVNVHFSQSTQSATVWVDTFEFR